LKGAHRGPAALAQLGRLAALPQDGGRFVEPAPPNLGKDALILDLFVETTHQGIQRFPFFSNNSRHALFTSSLCRIKAFPIMTPLQKGFFIAETAEYAEQY
jgi:hypothetical protein